MQSQIIFADPEGCSQNMAKKELLLLLNTVSKESIINSLRLQITDNHKYFPFSASPFIYWMLIWGISKIIGFLRLVVLEVLVPLSYPRLSEWNWVQKIWAKYHTKYQNVQTIKQKTSFQRESQNPFHRIIYFVLDNMHKNTKTSEMGQYALL